MENEELQEEMRIIQQELARTRAVLGTLIGWLVQELGQHNATELLDRLNPSRGIDEKETE